MGKGGDAHLERDAGESAEDFVDVEDFFRDGLGVADQEGAGGTAQGVKLGASGGSPAAFFADFGEGVGVAGEEILGGLLGGVSQKTDGVEADGEFIGGMAGAFADFAIEIDERAKSFRFAADDGDGERKSEDAGAREGFGRTADADPDGQRILQRTRIDGLARERRAMFAGPRDVRIFADGQEQLEFFGEERIVVFQFEAEQGEGFDEGAAPRDDFGEDRDRNEAGERVDP